MVMYSDEIERVNREMEFRGSVFSVLFAMNSYE